MTLAGNPGLAERLKKILAVEPVRIVSLAGGCIAEVYRIWFADGSSVVAKVAGADGTLDIEGFMLGTLRERSRLPVPRVLHLSPDLLVMEFIQGDSRFDAGAQRHAAELLAELHGVRADRFGLERDTLIGPLRQANGWMDSWIAFFRDRRLIAIADEASRAGRLPARVRGRIDALASRLGEMLAEPAHPSLLHGDVWTTNVLASGGRIAAFIDPAIYYGDPEIELAFITLFSTFDALFFERYAELRPIAAGFFEKRRHVYNLYPLLVHARLFGGGYVAQVDAVLGELGF